VIEMESLAYGGDGVGHAPEAIFVPGAAPGDRLRVRVVEQRRAWARAELTEILTPSPWRRPPPCALASACGGCQWQHVTEEAQRAAKQRAVEDALERIGRFRGLQVAPILAAGPALGYRHRIRLQVRQSGGRAFLGFHRLRSRDVVPVDRCLQMSEPLARAFERLRLAVTAAHPVPGLAEIELAVGTDDGPAVAAFRFPRGAARAAVGRMAGPLLDAGDLRGFAILDGRSRVETSRGEIELAYRIPEGAVPGAPFALRQRGWSFSQASWEANLLLLRTVLSALGEPPPRRLLELYAGSGNLTLPLAARRIAVTTVEGDGAAARDLEANLTRAGLRARVIHAHVEDALEKPEPVDAVLLDPPRAGAAALMPRLAAMAPRRIVYVSCDPAVLARDLSRLAEGGYRPETIQPLDLFPQTYHVETVAACVTEAS
jgi:23S rRNA (uracil1939-C5)-methyltransferase